MTVPGAQPVAACVLVVDEDSASRQATVRVLEREGMIGIEAADRAGARQALAAKPPPDLVVLDLAIGEDVDFEMLAEIHNAYDMPVIVLTRRTEEPYKLLALEMGADDFMAKPFSPLELTSRVRTVLRRVRPPERGGVIQSGQLRIDLEAREVTIGVEPVELTSREYEVLAYLAMHPGHVVSRASLLRDVWHSSPEWQDPATVTEHVRRIRTKLEADPAQPRWIHTVRGIGYRFVP